MPLRQKIFTLSVAVVIFLFVLELVRRRKLREEFSPLWIFASITMIIIVLRYEWLLLLTHFIGASAPTTTLFLFGLLFMIIINIYFSVKISNLSNQVKNLGQENALLKNKVESLRQETEDVPEESSKET